MPKHQITAAGLCRLVAERGNLESVCFQRLMGEDFRMSRAHWQDLGMPTYIRIDIMVQPASAADYRRANGRG